MRLVLILCSYTKDPDHALTTGRRYRAELTVGGIPSVFPADDFHDAWEKGELKMKDIESAVSSIYLQCTEILIVEKEGMTLEDVITESSGLQAEMKYMQGTRPVFYGIDNFNRRYVAPT